MGAWGKHPMDSDAALDEFCRVNDIVDKHLGKQFKRPVSKLDYNYDVGLVELLLKKGFFIKVGIIHKCVEVVNAEIEDVRTKNSKGWRVPAVTAHEIEKFRDGLKELVSEYLYRNGKVMKNMKSRTILAPRGWMARDHETGNGASWSGLMETMTSEINISRNVKLPRTSAKRVWTIYGKASTKKNRFMDQLCFDITSLPLIYITKKSVSKPLCDMEFVGVTADYNNMSKVVNAVASGGNCNIWSTGNIDTDRRAITLLCDMLYERSTNCVIIFTESGKYISQGMSTQKHDKQIRIDCAKAITDLMYTHNCGMIFEAKQPNDILGVVRNEADICMSFRMTPGMVKPLLDMVSDEITKEHISKSVPAYKDNEFLIISPSYINKSGAISDKLSW